MFGGLFDDDNGGISSTRIVFVLCMLIYFIVWGTISIRSNTIIKLDLIDLGPIALLLGSKVSQKAIEAYESKKE